MNDTINPPEAAEFFEEAAATLRTAAADQPSTVLQALKRLSAVVDAADSVLIAAGGLAESLLDGMEGEPRAALSDATMCITSASAHLFTASSKARATIAWLVFGGQA